MNLEILHQDADIIVVQKPSGLIVHPSDIAASDRVCVMGLLKAQLGGTYLYPVHRLDRPTSGALVFTTSSETARALAERFSNREVEKEYLALVRGHTEDRGVIDKPLATPKKYKRVKKSRSARKPREETDSKPSDHAPAFTEYVTTKRIEISQAIGRYDTARYSFVQVLPRTGRLHQIRRHFAGINHPLIGDRVYGDRFHNRFFTECLGLNRLCLHAQRLKFPHPRDGRWIEIIAPVPDDLTEIFTKLTNL